MYLYEPTNPLSLSTDNGAVVIVHNKTDHPAFYDAIGLSSGTKAGVLIERVFSYHLEYPYSDCVKDIDESYPSALIKTMLQKGYAYTQKNCFLACYQEFSFKKCGCYDVFAYQQTGVPASDANYTDILFCTNFTQMFCDSQVKWLIFINFS